MRRSHCRWVLHAIGVVAFLGCAEDSRVNQRNYVQPAAAAPAESPPSSEIGRAPEAAEKATTRSPFLSRKIVYNARIELVVENVPRIGAALARLIQENGGYIAETDILSDSQQQRQAIVESPGARGSVRCLPDRGHAAG